MAYRTTRAFRDQFRLLALLAQLEEAQAAASAEGARRRWSARRARRGLEAISDALAALVSQSSLGDVAAADLLPGVREYLEAQPPGFTVISRTLAWVERSGLGEGGRRSRHASAMHPTTAATYRRLRAAVVAAQDSGEFTVLGGSTELSLDSAARYARDYALAEGRHGVRASGGPGWLEIGPERRALVERRSGHDRRIGKHTTDLWTERRGRRERRARHDRRSAPAPLWQVALK
jgi:hypothetical protein